MCKNNNKIVNWRCYTLKDVCKFDRTLINMAFLVFKLNSVMTSENDLNTELLYNFSECSFFLHIICVYKSILLI